MLCAAADADDKGSITAELTGIGAQCRGERHLQVISRQREALIELRKRLRETEENSIKIQNVANMPQQIIYLKKELAEMRANQALTEDIARHANLMRGNHEGFLMIEEKTAHSDTQNALEQSEESFFTTLRSINSALELNVATTKRSMISLSPDERHKLILERSQSADLICSQIRFLKESLDNKEKLLKEYEMDLAKLRQAEFLLDKKSAQLDEIELSLRGKDDEIELLSMSLRNARSELDKEKLMNLAMKPKKKISITLERSIKKSVESINNRLTSSIDDLRLRKSGYRSADYTNYYDLKCLNTKNRFHSINRSMPPSN